LYSKIYYLYITMSTTQLNVRIPIDIKTKAQDKAEKIGTNLNFLIKLFLSKFITDDSVVHIAQNVQIDKVFDQAMIQHFTSTKGKKTAQNINRMLSDIVETEEEKYMK